MSAAFHRKHVAQRGLTNASSCLIEHPPNPPLQALVAFIPNLFGTRLPPALLTNDAELPAPLLFVYLRNFDNILILLALN